MKKGEVYEGTVTRMDFPNKGEVIVDGSRVLVKNALPGQMVRFRIQKLRKGQAQGQLLEVVERAACQTEKVCPHFGSCGGCLYQGFPYETQLNWKQEQVRGLLDAAVGAQYAYVFEEIEQSPQRAEYRNKMEFSFGDEFKGGPLALGMHRRNQFYDIVNVEYCRLVDEDFRRIRTGVQRFFENRGESFYHKISHKGFLRHLLVRKSRHTGEIMVALVTSSQEVLDEDAFVGMLRALLLDGRIVGILHMINDREADVVQSDRTRCLYGQDTISETLLGMQFQVTPFSFFQTNTDGAEVLYRVVREYAGETAGQTIFDLYSGTGTIAQILAPVAKKVIGIEIVEEAVLAARANAVRNQLSNCEFWAGDVLQVIDQLSDRPDMIVLDPPRDGIHPKALKKILEFGVSQLLYISCKPTSLVRDLEALHAYGYQIQRCRCVDMFPWTANIETVVKLVKKA